MTRVDLHPFDIGEAREAARLATRRQEDAEKQMRDAARDLAEKERQYRMALAQRITEAHAAGTAWTACQDIARGDRQVAQLRFERDVARGVLDAAQQSGWRHTADRKALLQFTDWSMRRELAENGAPDQGDGKLLTFGGRPAA